MSIDLVRNSTPWMELAVCREVDPEAFFPEQCATSGVRVVKKICAGCPVRLECLAHAINNKEIYGIWGGMAYEDRALLARAWQRRGGDEKSLVSLVEKRDKKELVA